MTINWLDQALPSVQGLTPYQPGRSMVGLRRETGMNGIIKLASNENPRGPSPRVQEAITRALPDLSRYPDGHELTVALSEKLSVDTRQITLGNGSNDVLDLIARAFLDADRTAVVSEHCFLVYPIVIALTGARMKTVPAQNYGHDLPAMLAAIDDTTAVVFIANPNNPTGTWITQDELEHFLEQIPESVVVVLDEAYLEYACTEASDYPNGLSLLPRYNNLVLTRTFSKVYGLAAARIGYALSNVEITDLLNRARQPFNTNSLALSAATVALHEDEYIAESLHLNHEGLKQVTTGLTELGLTYIPTAGNFVTFSVEKEDISAEEVNRSLLSQGVIVRPIANYGMPDHLRVTAGLPEENALFLQALTATLGRTT